MLVKARHGDLITLRDHDGNAVATVEIDRTRKRSVTMCIEAAACTVELTPLDERPDEEADGPAILDRQRQPIERGDVCHLIEWDRGSAPARRVVVSAIIDDERVTVRDLLAGPPLAVRPRDLVLYSDKTTETPL